MTEKKKIPGQTTLYHYRAGTRGPARPARRSSVARVRGSRPIREAPQSLQRVVTIPDADPSMAWHTFAQRQEQLRRTRARAQQYVVPVPRTLAQTGSRASSGRIKAIQRPLLQRQSTIPTRSGRAQRRGLLWRILSFFVIGIVCVLACSFVLGSSAFHIMQVNVTGTHNAALVHDIQDMGLQGQNIFLLNVEAVKERIEVSPLVAMADLSKQLPNQLLVAVTERVPVLLWQTAQGTYSVDKQGMIIAIAAQTAGADRLGTVVDVTRQDNAQKGHALRPGDHLDQGNIAFAANVLQGLPQVVGINTFKLSYDGTMYGSTSEQSGGVSGSKGSYIVESSAGWTANLGGASDADPLGNRLIELRDILQLAQQKQLDVATIDLRYGLRPVFTLQH